MGESAKFVGSPTATKILRDTFGLTHRRTKRRENPSLKTEPSGRVKLDIAIRFHEQLGSCCFLASGDAVQVVLQNRITVERHRLEETAVRPAQTLQLLPFVRDAVI